MNRALSSLKDLNVNNQKLNREQYKHLFDVVRQMAMETNGMGDRGRKICERCNGFGYEQN